MDRFGVFQENERKQKQDYLRTFIIDAGYNAADFVAFLQSQRQGGQNVDNWAIDQLKKIVSDFTANNQRTQQQPALFDSVASTNVSEAKQEQKVPQQQIDDVDSTEPPAQYPEETEEIEEFCETYKPEMCVLSQLDEPAYVEVTEPDATEGGVFSRTHISYKISVFPVGWEVHRRLSELRWVRQALVKQFPQCLIPPLPPSSSKNKLDPVMIKRKSDFMRKFLNCVLRSKLLCTSAFLNAFLKETDPKKTKDLKKLISKIKQPTSLDTHITPEGKANITVDRKSIDFCAKFEPFIVSHDNLSTRLVDSLEDVSQGLQNVANSLYETEKVLEHLSKLHENMGNTSMRIMTRTLNKVIRKWSESYVKQAIMVKNKIAEEFKFVELEGIMYRDLLKQRETFKNQYFKIEPKLQAKKQKAFEQGDITKWDLPADLKYDKSTLLENKNLAKKLMFPKETEQFLSKRKLLGFYSNQCKEEVHHFNNEKFEVLRKSMMATAKQYCQQLTNIHVLWANFVSICENKFEDSNESEVEESPKNVHMKESELQSA